MTSTRHGHRPRNINTQSLITFRTIYFGGTVTTPYLTTATLNARSFKNKNQLLFQKLVDDSIDIGIITETWLENTQEDKHGSNNWLCIKIHIELCLKTDLETTVEGD